MDYIMSLQASEGKTTIMVVIYRLSEHGHFLALNSNFIALQVSDIMVRDVIKHYKKLYF